QIDLVRPGVTQAVGSPGFAAPEQWEGQADHRADIYAVGATLFVMLTGSLYRDPNQAERALRQTPEPVAEIIRSCLSRDPDQRFQNARDLTAALEAARRSIAELPTRDVDPADDRTEIGVF